MLPVLGRDHPCSALCSSLGGCSPSIFMPDINFHPFQYFMSVTIKKKKKKGSALFKT